MRDGLDGEAPGGASRSRSVVEELERDVQTVTPEGARVAPMIEGVRTRSATTHADERGTVCEIYDPAWGFTEEPMVYAYQITIRSGKVKGWVMHREQDDRLFLSSGTVKVALYDGRPESSTHEMIDELFLSEHHRSLLRIPAGVFHAVKNVGEGDALLVNLPTRPYRHANPDKYRLPADSKAIDYQL